LECIAPVLVIGITDGITCGAAIIQDGTIVAAVNEERLSRLKMAYGFPRQSIAEVMALAGVSPGDIDLVAAATINNYFFDGVRPFDGWIEKDKGLVRNSVFSAAGELARLVDVIPGAEAAYYKARAPIFALRRRAIRRIVEEEFGIAAPVEFVNHHLAHATSAYFTSGFKDATVVTMDGGGDGASAHVYEVRDGRFRRVGFTSAFNSLGNYYAYITHICGFKAQKHEGKITGLAAHGTPRYLDLLNSFITIEQGELKNVGRVVFTSAVRALRKRLPAGWTKEDLAASIQAHSERLATAYVRHHLTGDAPRDLAIAGGIFANVRINQEVAEIPGVNRLFVHPGMTDQGLAVGATLVACMANRKRDRMPREEGVIRDVYLGRGYGDGEIEEALRRSGLNSSKPRSIEAEVARLLAQGHVVARFAGRMEYGPRALGNRSILYQPADRSVNDWLNKHLQRTEFMPFAPSTLMEHAEEYFDNVEPTRDSARFMTTTYDCTELTKRTCPGVVHIDGTARPQLICEEDNPSYHTIIDEFRKLTGVASIINTSFNMHEEPIVCTPDDAIRAFRLGHLDYLAIGDYLVPSPEPLQHALRPMEAARVPERVPATSKG
jgi:carbamoyltransferase